MKALSFSDFSIIPISFINDPSSAAYSFVASVHKSRKLSSITNSTKLCGFASLSSSDDGFPNSGDQACA